MVLFLVVTNLQFFFNRKSFINELSWFKISLMQGKSFQNILINKFPFEPTESQERGFTIISNFIIYSKKNELLLIKGYAGTGKTTLIGHLVNHLSWVKKKSVLLAPTGRAAKVLSFYSGKPAFTIHKKYIFQNLLVWEQVLSLHSKKTSTPILFLLLMNPP